MCVGKFVRVCDNIIKFVATKPNTIAYLDNPVEIRAMQIQINTEDVTFIMDQKRQRISPFKMRQSDYLVKHLLKSTTARLSFERKSRLVGLWVRLGEILSLSEVQQHLVSPPSSWRKFRLLILTRSSVTNYRTPQK